jgi:hypothetical protein
MSLTLTKRTFSSGVSSRSRLVVASSSIVGIVPQPASTTSGSATSSLEAKPQRDAPASTCASASSIVSHCGSGCFEAITRLIVLVLSRTFAMVATRVLASGGR